MSTGPNIFAPVQVTTTAHGSQHSSVASLSDEEIQQLIMEFHKQPQNIAAGSTVLVRKSLSGYTIDELREELRSRAVSNLYRGDAVSEQELDRLAQWCQINPDKLSQLVMMIGLPVPCCEMQHCAVSALYNLPQKPCGAPVLYLTNGHKYCPPCAESYLSNQTEDKRIRWSATT